MKWNGSWRALIKMQSTKEWNWLEILLVMKSWNAILLAKPIFYIWENIEPVLHCCIDEIIVQNYCERAENMQFGVIWLYLYLYFEHYSAVHMCIVQFPHAQTSSSTPTLLHIAAWSFQHLCFLQIRTEGAHPFFSCSKCVRQIIKYLRGILWDKTCTIGVCLLAVPFSFSIRYLVLCLKRVTQSCCHLRP